MTNLAQTCTIKTSVLRYVCQCTRPVCFFLQYSTILRSVKMANLKSENIGFVISFILEVESYQCLWNYSFQSYKKCEETNLKILISLACLLLCIVHSSFQFYNHIIIMKINISSSTSVISASTVRRVLLDCFFKSLQEIFKILRYSYISNSSHFFLHYLFSVSASTQQIITEKNIPLEDP